MDIKTPIKLEGARLARAPAAGALCALAFVSLLAPPHAAAQTTLTPAQQAVMLHTRLTGVPPSAANLAQMTTDITGGNLEAAAAVATSQPQFYNVTLRNI